MPALPPASEPASHPDEPPDPQPAWSPTHLVLFDSERIADSYDHPLVAYDWAWVRLTPRVETGEFVNVGVIVYCRTRRFLGARIVCNRPQLAALASKLAPAEIEQHLALIPAMCAGEGPIGALGQAEVFHWLVAPHSTVIQTSEVHAGLCADPQEALEHLANQLRTP